MIWYWLTPLIVAVIVQLVLQHARLSPSIRRMFTVAFALLIAAGIYIAFFMLMTPIERE
jgi:hypothetical protein